MIAVTAIITAAVTAVVTTVTRYVSWQLNVLEVPLYTYIFFHALLFSVLLIVFFDSRKGFPGTRHLVASAFVKLRGNPKQEAKKSITSYYRERLNKRKLPVLSILFTIFISYAVYSQLFFFGVVTSNSMYPTFEKGDLVLMQKIKTEPNVGDIVMYRSKETPMPITHRVIEISGNTYKTKGDNNANADRWGVNKGDVMGIAVAFNGKPIIKKDTGNLFLIDYTVESPIKYRPEYGAMAKGMQMIRQFGIAVFAFCLLFFMYLSLRKPRRA